MYKPVQKKSSSWTPVSSQNKSKSLTKPGTFSVQPKPESKSSQQQQIPDYSSKAADALAANVMRSLETQAQSVEQGKDLDDEMSVGAGAIQTKLTVGAAGDKYEQEADQVAAQVMSMSVTPDASPQVQRFGEEDNPVQRWSLAQSITPVVQRQVDEQVQMRELVQRAFQAGGNEASGDLESRLNASKGGGSALAPEVRAFMEPRFGADFSSVRVHTGGEAVQMNRELGAQAFAHGSDVYFGAGKSPGNNELTAHELTHVVQQGSAGQLQRSQNVEQLEHQNTEEASVSLKPVMPQNETTPNIQRWVAPTDWLDYIGLGVDLIERAYIELAYEEGEEKDFRRFENTLFFAIDLILAALPGAGGGGLAVRGSRQLAVAGWGVIPDSAKVQVAEQVAKQMGWSVAKATQMINLYMKSGEGGGKGGGGGSGKPPRKDWQITKENTDRVVSHKKFGTFHRHKTTGLWWSKDTAGHGGSVWKVFKETPKGLEWVADADRYGDFIVGKHKGEIGKFIPWPQLN
jgi:hypothetical protein